jgi:murein DD-endopeptidase MepM/ murein hydrolase activator NlpD
VRRHPVRTVLITVLVVAAAVPERAGAAVCWAPPVAAPVADPFREPECRWCPGNRGLEYATPSGRTVRAVGTGRVTFAGPVAGVVYAVVEHRDGRRVTYGNLAATRHRRGDVVLRGHVVGTTAGPLHLGVREGEHYVDPAPLIGRWVGVPRLVPVDGTPAAPAPSPRLRCTS